MNQDGSSCADIGSHSSASPRNNVISFLEQHRRQAADRPALLWAGPDFARDASHQRWTFSELAQRCESAAAGFSGLGLAPGDRVFVFVPMSPALYVVLFSVQRLGAIPVFLDSWARKDQLGSCMEQATPRAFVGPAAAMKLLEGDPRAARIPIRVTVGAPEGSAVPRLDDLMSQQRSCPIQPVDRHHPALITFTTGSSGAPKGANRTHRFLTAQHHALTRALPFRPDDIDLPVFPIFSLHNLASGVTTVLPAIDLARPAESDGETLARQMQSTKAVGCTLSPSLLRGVSKTCREKGIVLHDLRRCATGGAPISSDDVAAFRAIAPGAEVHILYGSTEVEPIAHLEGSSMPADSEGEGVCVGTIAEGLEWKLLRITRDPIELDSRDWTLWETPPGAPGELIVCGDHVCEGYYNNEEAFRRAKIRDRRDRIWHRTGDVGKFDSRGRLWLLGRVHNAICRGKEILFPVKAEFVMQRLPFVKTAAYLALPDPTLGERVCAAFTLRENAIIAAPEQEVRSALIREGILVDEVRRVSDIPLDPRHHSKVEYSILRERLAT